MSHRMTSGTFAGAVAAVTLLAAACGSSSSKASSAGTTAPSSSSASTGAAGSALPSEIHILGISDQSGANASVGIAELDGWKLAVNAVNSARTLGTSKLVLSSEDTQSSPTQGASLATQAIGQHYPVVLYGPSSAIAPGMAAIFKRANQDAVFVQAGSSGIVIGPTIFRLTPTMDTFFPLALQYLQSKQVASLADIYLNDNPTYVGIDQLIAQDASKYGYTYTGHVGVTTTQTDVSAAVSKLASMHTDAVAILMNGAPAATVVGELRQQGYKGVIIAAPNIAANNVLAAVGAAANGVVWPNDWDATSTNSKSEQFVTAYKAAYGTTPNNYAAEAYDAVLFIADALKNAKGLSSSDVTQALANLGQTGFNGVLGNNLTLKSNSEVGSGQLAEWENGAPVAING